jgi:hypothetical protein
MTTFIMLTLESFLTSSTDMILYLVLVNLLGIIACLVNLRFPYSEGGHHPRQQTGVASPNGKDRDFVNVD